MVGYQETPIYTEFASIIMAWPRLVDLAYDIGVTMATVSNWKQRNNIPEEYWADIVRAAESRGYVGIGYQQCQDAAAHWRRTHRKRAAGPLPNIEISAAGCRISYRHETSPRSQSIERIPENGHRLRTRDVKWADE